MATNVKNSMTDNSTKDNTGDAINGSEVDENPNAIADILDGTTDVIMGGAAQTRWGYGAVFNEDSQDSDFRVEGNGNSNLINLDAGQDAISFGGANVDGSAVAFNNLTTRTAITSVGQQVHIPAQTQNFDNGSGTIAIGAANFIGIPTMTGASATLTMTNAATLYIQGAPVASTNVTHTTAGYSLWIDAGYARFDERVAIGHGSPGYPLHVEGVVAAENISAAGGGVREVVRFGIDPASGTASDDDGGRWTMYADDDGGNQTDIARMDWVLTDASNTTEDSRIDVAVITNGTLANELSLTGAALYPSTDDGLTLGILNSNEWSDFFLASGGVIGWNNNDVTITHAAGKLTFGGDGAVELDFNNHEMTNVDVNSGAIDGTVIGAASAAAGSFAAIVGTSLDLNGDADISGDLTLSAGADGALTFANAGENSIKIPDNQASALIIEEANNAYMTFVSTDGGEKITLGKDLDLGSNNILLGSGGVIGWNSSDVTLTHASNLLTVGGGDLHIGNGLAFVVGHTAQITGTQGQIPEVQFLGTGYHDTGIQLGRFSADSGGPVINFISSRSTTIGSSGAVQDGDTVGAMYFGADDGGDFQSQVAGITAKINGSPGTNDTPGQLEFLTTADGAASPGVKLRIEQDGGLFALSLASASASTDLNINGSNEIHSVTSSAEYKDDLRILEADTSRIYKLAVKSFTWAANSASSGEEDFGLIAEEAYTVYPEIVTLRKDVEEYEKEVDGNGGKQTFVRETGPLKPYSIRNPALVMSLLAEMQKLNDRVKALEAA